MTTMILIDADPIVYRSGFASESNEYRIVLENEDTDEVSQAIFHAEKDKSAYKLMKEYIAQHPELKVLDTAKNVVSEPLENALHIVGETLESIRAAIAGPVTFRAFLSGGDNFRYKLATLKPYKGNRDPTHKPVHYSAIREYIKEHWYAEVVDGREADDQISIIASRMRKDAEPYVVATIDKDLDQIPGRHYDYMKKVNYAVGPWSATYWFYTQVLTGDTTDNIAGCYRCGPAMAEKVLANAFTSGACWEAVVLEYRKAMARPAYPWGPDYAAIALENARLVYLQQEEGELWTPPNEPKQWLE